MAFGAAVQGAVLSGESELEDKVLLADVVLLSMGIEAVGGVMTETIELCAERGQVSWWWATKTASLSSRSGPCPSCAHGERSGASVRVGGRSADARGGWMHLGVSFFAWVCLFCSSL